MGNAAEQYCPTQLVPVTQGSKEGNAAPRCSCPAVLRVVVTASIKEKVLDNILARAGALTMTSTTGQVTVCCEYRSSVWRLVAQLLCTNQLQMCTALDACIKCDSSLAQNFDMPVRRSPQNKQPIPQPVAEQPAGPVKQSILHLKPLQQPPITLGLPLCLALERPLRPPSPQGATPSGQLPLKRSALCESPSVSKAAWAPPPLQGSSPSGHLPLEYTHHHVQVPKRL